VHAAMKNPVVQATFPAKTRECIEGFVAFIERTRAGLAEAGAQFPVPVNRPSPDSSEEGRRRLSAPGQFPSWDGSGVGSRAQDAALYRRNLARSLSPGEMASEPLLPTAIELSELRQKWSANFSPLPAVLGGPERSGLKSALLNSTAGPPLTPSPGTTAGGDEAGKNRALQVWAQNFLAETGYLDELRRSEKEPETAENRVRNLQDLVASMDDGERPMLPLAERLQSFLEELALDSGREDEKENTGDAVTLITMHSCKGLEFPRVYIVGLEDGLLPHSRSKVEGTLDEERRLFYVAITRAMESLTISHCTGRKKYGQITPCYPSRFLVELPAELVEHADEKARQPLTVDAGRDLFSLMRSALE